METQKRKYKKHKQGYKITATHYLRKERSNVEKLIAKNKVGEDGQPKFPLYIKVLFLGHSVKLRSRLELDLTEIEFENLESNSPLKLFMEREIATIHKSIEQLKPDQIPNFSISQWTNYYTNGNKSIYDCASDVVMNELKKSLCKKYKFSPATEKPFRLGTKHISQLLWLAELNIPEAIDLKHRVEPLLILPEINNQLKESSGVDLDFTYWDWKFGYFQNIDTRFNTLIINDLLVLLKRLMSHFESKILTTESPYSVIFL